jgi:hypothetical protein
VASQRDPSSTFSSKAPMARDFVAMEQEVIGAISQLDLADRAKSD